MKGIGAAIPNSGPECRRRRQCTIGEKVFSAICFKCVSNICTSKYDKSDQYRSGGEKGNLTRNYKKDLACMLCKDAPFYDKGHDAESEKRPQLKIQEQGANQLYSNQC